MRKPSKRLLLIVFAFFGCQISFSQPAWSYAVDPNFSTGNLFRNESKSVIEILPLNDGRLVLSGNFEQTSPFTSPFRGIGRILSDGSADAWGGAQGESVSHTRLLSDSSFIAVIGLSRASKITFEGSYWSTVFGFAWGDYFPQGFGVPNPYNVGNVWSLYIQEDEKVIIGGAIANDTLQPNVYRILTRLNPDGSHDPTFPIVEAQPNSSQIYANRIHRDSQGRWYLSGNFNGINNHPTYSIARLNPDFSVDESFTSPFIHTTGMLIRPMVRYIDEWDRVWISGSQMNMASNPGNYIQMLRLMPDGSVDESFIPRKLSFVYPDLDQYSNLSPRGPLFAGVHKLGDTGHYIVYGQFNHFNDTAASCIAVIDDFGNLQLGYFNGSGAHGNLLINGIGTWFFYPSILALHETTDGDLALGGLFGKFDGVDHYNVVKLKRGTVGTNNAAVQRDLLRLWPNPSSTTVTIHLPGHTLTNATLCDMQGREVLSVPLSTGEQVLDVRHLPKGMYLVRATDMGGGVYVKKLILL